MMAPFELVGQGIPAPNNSPAHRLTDPDRLFVVALEAAHRSG